MYIRHVDLTEIDIVIGFLLSFFWIRGKRGGSYVEALSSVDKRSDAGDTFDSRKKRKKKLLASLLEIK
jgi:hypothetical protein